MYNVHACLIIYNYHCIWAMLVSTGVVLYLLFACDTTLTKLEISDFNNLEWGNKWFNSAGFIIPLCSNDGQQKIDFAPFRPNKTRLN